MQLGRAAGAVDLAWVSQYPHLAELVLLPYTLLDINTHCAAVATTSLDDTTRKGLAGGPVSCASREGLYGTGDAMALRGLGMEKSARLR